MCGSERTCCDLLHPGVFSGHVQANDPLRLQATMLMRPRLSLSATPASAGTAAPRIAGRPCFFAKLLRTRTTPLCLCLVRVTVDRNRLSGAHDASCVFVVLPACIAGKNGKLMRPKKTILCVDDNEQSLSVRKFMLETRGYRVLTALNAAQALELYGQGGIDLVLSDLIMPQMDGNELIHRMKSIQSDVPMILMSGSVRAYERASHADAFLPKGACSPVEVLERIRIMIARKRGPKKSNQANVQEGEVQAGAMSAYAS